MVIASLRGANQDAQKRRAVTGALASLSYAMFSAAQSGRYRT
jgi:hypothetical protein